MMKILNFFVALLLSMSAIAQPTEKDLKKHRDLVEKSRQKGNTVHSLDTIFNSGEPYCIYKITSKDGPQVYEAYMKALNGSGEIFIEYFTENKGLKYAYRYYFIRSGEVADVPLNVFKKAEEFVTEMELYNPDGFNEAGKADVLKKYPGKLSPPRNYPIAKNEVMIRKWEKPISIYGRDVMQDNRIIAKIEKEFILEDGDIRKRITILNDRGNKVAHADAVGMENYTYTIITARENKSHDLKTQLGKENMDIITWLVKNGYL